MRKTAMVAAAVLMAALLYGCSAQSSETTAETTAQMQGTTQAETTEVAEGIQETTEGAQTEGEGDDESLRIGMGVITDTSSSKSAGNGEDGLAQADTTVAGVLLDAEGRILDCVIDASQSKVNFDQSGKLTSDTGTAVQSKNVLGDAYGMKTYSSIGKEWNEQAQAFADYCVGKTLDEVRGIQVVEGKAGDTDLVSSVTMGIDSLRAAVIKAVKNAVVCDAQPDDRLGLAMKVSTGDSADAGEAEGTAQTYGTYALTAVTGDGVISACVVDALQANISFSSEGDLVTDTTQRMLTKNELGDDYGMRVASSIGKEWYEQAAAFGDYSVGKTADEVDGIAVSEGVAADADLVSQVTLYPGDFMEVVAAAARAAE